MASTQNRDDVSEYDAEDYARIQAELKAEADRTIFAIPTYNMDAFEAEIAKLSRRAVKLGFSPITPVVQHTETREASKVLEGGRKVKFKYEVKIVHLDAPTVKAGNWRFVACLDHANDVGNIVRSVPNTGVTIPQAYHTAKSFCEHCRVDRQRNDTYLLCDDAGSFNQVGSSCLKDFFGYDPKALARMAEFLADAGAIGGAAEDEMGFGGGGGGRGDAVMLHEFLAFTALEIRLHGWVSGGRSRAENLSSTKTGVLTNMFPPTIRGVKQKTIPPEAEDRALAEAALEWAQSLRDRTDITSDYLNNVRVIAWSPVVTGRNQGIAASIIEAYKRDLVRAETARRAAENAEQISISDMTGIFALFDKARENGKKNPKVRLWVGDRETGKELVLTQASAQSVQPGSINVKSVGSFETADWYGRIRKDGQFEASKRCVPPEGTADMLNRFAADPDTVATEYGRITQNCSYCDKPLSGAEAIEVGYGKTCAQKWGRPFPTKAGRESSVKKPAAEKKAKADKPAGISVRSCGDEVYEIVSLPKGLNLPHWIEKGYRATAGEINDLHTTYRLPVKDITRRG